jgi:hypothetical protein
MNAIDVILRRRDKPGKAGYQYEVWRDGAYLLTSRDPEYATCRFLLAQGLRGLVRFWREGKATHDSSLDIERGAKCAATESRATSIRVRRYEEFNHALRDNDDEDEALERVGVYFGFDLAA